MLALMLIGVVVTVIVAVVIVAVVIVAVTGGVIAIGILLVPIPVVSMFAFGVIMITVIVVRVVAVILFPFRGARCRRAGHGGLLVTTAEQSKSKCGDGNEKGVGERLDCHGFFGSASGER